MYENNKMAYGFDSIIRKKSSLQESSDHFCTLLESDTSSVDIYVNSCHHRFHEVLCELPLKSDETKTYDMILLNNVTEKAWHHLPESFRASFMTTCTQNHFSWAFLKRSLLENCRIRHESQSIISKKSYSIADTDIENKQENISRTRRLETIEQDLRQKSGEKDLPEFLCQEGRDQYIPYTLVCDFRQDCLTSSDEDFCQYFPQARSKGYCYKNAQPCGVSKQVKYMRIL